MTARRAQAGFTLVEVMLVSSLFLVVLAATLTSFTNFQRRSHEGDRTAEQVETARATLDRAARQMRNLARRNTAELVIRKVAPTDLIFQTSSPDKRWMRYCIGTANTTLLYQQESTSSTYSSAMSGGTAGTCPATTGWSRTQVAASNVRNLTQATPEAVFGYQCTAGSASSCPRDTHLTEDSDKLKNVSMTLLIDTNPAVDPPAMRVTSSVFLRNQNEPPVPDFTYTKLGSGKVLLNGSASMDPEGRTLRYFFFKGAVPSFQCSSLPPDGYEYYTGVAPTYTFPIGNDGNYIAPADFTLVICDAGDLKSTSATKPVSP